MSVVRTFRKGKRGKRGGVDESTVAVVTVIETEDSCEIQLVVSNEVAGLRSETSDTHALSEGREKLRETLAALRAEGFRLETTKRRS